MGLRDLSLDIQPLIDPPLGSFCFFVVCFLIRVLKCLDIHIIITSKTYVFRKLRFVPQDVCVIQTGHHASGVASLKTTTLRVERFILSVRMATPVGHLRIASNFTSHCWIGKCSFVTSAVASDVGVRV